MAANNLVNTKAELISEKVQRELTTRVNLLAFMDDWSEMAVKGAGSMSLPKLSQFTAQDRAFGAEGTDQNLTDSKDTIALDKNKIVKWNYDAADAMQSSMAYQTKAALRASSAHVRAINAEVISVWNAVAGNVITASAGTPITFAEVKLLVKFLKDNYADMNQSYILTGTGSEMTISDMDKFTDANLRGDGNSYNVTGAFGKILGLQVVSDPTIGENDVYVVNKEGSAYGIQRDAKYAEQPNLDYGSDGKKSVVDMTYGLGGTQIGEGTAAAGKTPFISYFDGALV